MKLKLSISTKLKGSHKGSYLVNDTKYCYGKGTTFDYKTVESEGLASLIPSALFSAVSPYLYQSGHRDRKGVVGVGNVLILDIDAEDNIEALLFQSLSQFPYQYLVVPTQNHLTPVNGTKWYYKYRLMIPMKGITNVQQYKAAIRWVVNTYKFTNVDEATYTDARFFAPTFPIVGQTFAKYKASDNKAQPITVTQEMVEAIYKRVGMFDEQSRALVLNPTLYPQRLEGDILTYHDTMAQHSIVAEDTAITSEISGRVMSKVFESNDNTLTEQAFKRLYEKDHLALGDIASSLRPDQRVFCECPTKHNHSDESDIRYSWLLKTGSGETRLYCASDHCKKDYGEYRRIVLPKWTELVIGRNYAKTTSRVEELVEKALYTIVIQTATYICNLHNVTLSEWHEQVAYTRDMLFKHYLDENALYCLALLVVKRERTNALYDLSLAGGMKGLIVVNKSSSLMQGGWFSYLFKPKWRELTEYAKDKELTKFKILMKIVDTVAGDVAFTTIVKETTILRPSLQYDSSLSVDLTMEGRVMEVVNSSFDEPVFRHHKALMAKGVPAYPNYPTTIQAFLHHWRLPYGAVPFGANSITDLPSLLILFSALNMYSDGNSNQRHTAFVITAPSGVGKSALIKNFADVGLSNDDSHNASVFGYEGLYPQSVDNMKNKLWTTGDELSPVVMKKQIAMPTLLSNLTRSQIRVNIKSQIDSEFTSFGKVLWGAKAWEAISTGAQATELRNRLFAITYTSEMFENDDGTPNYFLNLCEHDDGTIDSIIQHWLADRYIQIKASVLSVPFEQRIKLFLAFKEAVKLKYAGTLEYDMQYDEETGKATTPTVKRVATDEVRGVVQSFKVLLEYASRMDNIRGDAMPIYLNLLSPHLGYMDREALSVLGAEEIMHGAFQSEELDNVVILPMRRAGMQYENLYRQICEHLYGEDSRKTYSLSMKFNGNAFRKAFVKMAVAYEHELTYENDPSQVRTTLIKVCGNRNHRTKAVKLFGESLPKYKAYLNKFKTDTKSIKYLVVPIEWLENYIEENS